MGDVSAKPLLRSILQEFEVQGSEIVSGNKFQESMTALSNHCEQKAKLRPENHRNRLVAGCEFGGPEAAARSGDVWTRRPSRGAWPLRDARRADSPGSRARPLSSARPPRLTGGLFGKAWLIEKDGTGCL